MPTVYIVAAVPIVVLVSLSAIAGYWVGDLDRLPMQWNFEGRPTWYAPKWIALGFAPVLSLVLMSTLVVSETPDGAGNGPVRNVATAGAIMIAAHLFYLYLLRKHLLG